MTHRILPLDAAHADAATATTLAAVRSKFGRVPNLLGVLAHAPAALNGYLALSETAASGRLTAAQREIVALAVGQANECRYCLSAHTAIARSTGLDATAIHAARRHEGGMSFDAAVAAVAEQLTSQRGRLTSVQLDVARAAGIDDGLLIEIVALVALNTLTNYVNHVADTPIDFPEVALDIAASRAVAA